MKQLFLGAVAVGLTCISFTVAASDIVDGVAAIVNERVITYSEVKNYVQPLVAQLRRDYSGDELVEKVRTTQVDALNRLIERALIIDEFKEKGYNIPEKVVEEQINDFIANDFGGDRAAFIKTLQAQNMTLSQFRERERERIIVQAMLNQKTQREVVVSPYKIEKYYKDHPDDFKVDEQIKLRMILIRKSPPLPASIPSTGSETDQPQAAVTELTPSASTTNLPAPSNAASNEPGPSVTETDAPAPGPPASVTSTNEAAHATILTNETASAGATNGPEVTATATNSPAQPPVDPHRALADEILAKLDEGESFESLAKVYSEGKEGHGGGDWGWIGHDVLRKELNETAFSFKPGEHSRLIETDDGYYILQVDDLKSAHARSLAEVRDEIEKTLLQQQRTKMQDEWVKELRAKAYIRLF
jgi:parvulin-like peptidyl-prolyl isomerase